MKVIKFATDITDEVQNRSLAMLEMSTPVAKIWDGVLFAPIVGIVDSRRSRDIMNKALSSIVDNRAHTLMLDIGGVCRCSFTDADNFMHITFQSLGHLGRLSIILVRHKDDATKN